MKRNILFTGLFLVISCIASAQIDSIPEDIKITDPANYPYGVDIDVNYSTIWAREFGLSYNSTGKLFSFGVFGNGSTLTYGYIGGNTSSTTPAGSPWEVFMPNGNVGIGTTNPQSLLAVAGTVTAKQVAVSQTGWSDFVFDSTYQCMPLDKVAAYTRTHKHLPDIPSASEVEQKGLDLGAMEKLHMQKIEELTLYAIDADKRATKDEALIAQQRATLDQQQVLLLQLQAQLKVQQQEIDHLKTRQ